MTDGKSLKVRGTVAAGAGDTLALTTTGTSNNLAIDASMTASTIDLVSSGKVTENNAGAVITNLINVTANTGISLTSTANDIINVGTDYSTSGPNTIIQN